VDEAQRFLRYLTPGLTFVILIASYSYLSQHDWTLKFTKDFLSQNSVGTAIGLFFVSGGIGFLLSAFHHVLFWSPIYRRLALVTDYRQVLEHAVGTGRLELRLRDEVQDIAKRRLSHAGSWRVVSSLWHERRESSARIKGADRRTVSLSDIMHGAGTAFIGAVAALVVWAYLHLRHTACWPGGSFWIVLVVAVAVAGVHLWNFRQTVEHCQGVIGTMLSNELRLERLDKKRPAVVILSETDLESQTPFKL